MNPRGAAVVVFSERELRRRGLAAALDANPGVAVAAVTGDVRDIDDLLHTNRAEGLIIDLEDVGADEFNALRSVCESLPDSVSVVCFAPDDNAHVASAADFAYVLDVREGIDLAIAALQKETRRDPVLQRRVQRRETINLTRREYEILQELARGRSAAEAGAALGISPKTVDVHKGNLYAKLGARSQAQAVAIALQRRILDPPRPTD